jgi:hypothetical protein
MRSSTWNTAGRPTASSDPPIEPYVMGFNTDTNKLEMWTGSAWVGITLS